MNLSSVHKSVKKKWVKNIWAREKRRFLAAVFACASAFAPFQVLCASQVEIELSIGDTPDRGLRKNPALTPYLGKIQEEVQATDRSIRDLEKEWKKCEQENIRREAQHKTREDCDEVLSGAIEISESGFMIDAALAYRSENVSFDVPGAWMLRLRQGVNYAVREIQIDLRPVYRDINEMLQRFDELSISVERLSAALDGSGLQRFLDTAKISRRPSANDRIFSVQSLRRNLVDSESTKKFRNGCLSHHKYLLGAWSNDEIFALLELTREDQGFNVVPGGGEGAFGKGYRLAFVVANNSLQGGRFRPVNSWVNSYPVDDYRLSKVDRGNSWCSQVGRSYAETINVLGKNINLQPPPGYCSLRQVNWGSAYMRRHAEIHVRQGLLLQIAVPCSEIDGGPETAWTQWIVVIAPPRKNGQLMLESRTRQEFLASLGPESLDSEQVNRMLAQRSGPQQAVQIQSTTYAGSDEWAGYWVVQSEQPMNSGERRRIRGVMAATSLNEIALAIQVHQSEGAVTEPLDVARSYVRALFP